MVEEGDNDSPEPERPIIGPQPSAIYKLPLTRLAKETAGTPLARNMVALGALSELFGLPDKEMKHSIKKMFAHRARRLSMATSMLISRAKIT